MLRWVSLVLVVVSTSPMSLLSAQEIYKWEDKNGVVHYSNTPSAPTAAPLNTTDIPYSHTGSLPKESAEERNVRSRGEKSDIRFERQPRLLHGLPSLSRTRAGLVPNGHLHLSGVIHMRGTSPCQEPAVEVAIFDELGNLDGNFATAARSDLIMAGEEASFEGDYITPVGGSFTWEAAPRCSTSDGPIYGAHQRGSLKTTSGRIIHAKKLRRR